MSMMTLSAYLLEALEIEKYAVAVLWMVVISSALTFLLSYLSYRCFEMPFLRMKNRFTPVAYSDNR
jgi:peptidoglycan/LPS O-acetylase OafA/YrhL